MSIMDTIINQQVAMGRTMECPMVILAQQYKVEADALNNANQIFNKENEFRIALTNVPEYTYIHSMMALAYFFKNENSYSNKQQEEILKVYVNHIMSSITPENKIQILGFLNNLLPSKRRPDKLKGYPILKALVESKLNENI